MIKYNLICNNKHEFESWFSNSDEFDKLKKKRLLECIFCKSKVISKSIMAPRIANSRNSENEEVMVQSELKKIKKDLLKIRNFVEKNFRYVGDKFSSEVRNIYYDKKAKKNIYGTTTAEERKELQEEGIELSSIPWIDKEN
tara:strand:- start:312 stop:734 length:423 start_codon:yes stop_codon:yes gene_type:complete